jgi:hypothetical protein
MAHVVKYRVHLVDRAHSFIMTRRQLDECLPGSVVCADLIEEGDNETQFVEARTVTVHVVTP